MTIVVKKYPLDLTGSSPNNRIVNEKHTISNTSNVFFTLNTGCFFEKSIRIYSVAKTSYLDYQEDYLLRYLNIDATQRSGLGIYAMIHIVNPNIKGELLVSYQAIGGNYANIHSAIEDALKEIQDVTNPVYWDDVLGKPSLYPPEPHDHIMDDLTGVNGIVESLDNIACAIDGMHPNHRRELEIAISKRVANLYAIKRSLEKEVWNLSHDNPLWIRIYGAVNRFTITFKIWDTDSGDTEILLSCHIDHNGNIEVDKVIYLYGDRPTIELNALTYDGTWVDILLRSTDLSSQYIIADKIIYYSENYPIDIKVISSNMDELDMPVPEPFITPKPAWGI